MNVSSEIFDFLRDLSQNNNREWFNTHKARYEKVKSSFERLTEQFIALVAEVDPSVGTLQAKDCIYRIYRDTRFSHDKTPYKTHLCCFVSRGGRKSHLPGYYLQLEPGRSCFGGGVYCLDADEIKMIRREICNFPENLLAAVENDDFRQRMMMHDGDKLKTFPKGFDTDFEGAEYLKYRYWSSYVEYTDEQCQADDFGDVVRQDLRLAYPLNRFLLEAMEAPDDEVDF